MPSLPVRRMLAGAMALAGIMMWIASGAPSAWAGMRVGSVSPVIAHAHDVPDTWLHTALTATALPATTATPTSWLIRAPSVSGSAAARGYTSSPAQFVVAANAGDGILRLSTRDSWGKLDTLDDHFLRHGADFGATSADDYARQASEFFQRGIKDGLPTKIDPKTGVVRIFDPATDTFGAYNPAGTTRTFYKPDPAANGYASNWDYWLAQPGYAP